MLVVGRVEDKVLTGLGVSSFSILAVLTVSFSLFLSLAALSFVHTFQVWPSLRAVWKCFLQ